MTSRDEMRSMRRDELFRAEWRLIEIYRYAQLFSGPHGQAADVHAG
ncbi:hypothetical protein [Actinopolymorpha sp. B9G3]